jgi:hypothetical protein
VLGCNAVHAFLLTYFLLLLTTIKPYGKRYTISHQNLRLPGRAVYDGIYTKSFETERSGPATGERYVTLPTSNPRGTSFRHPNEQGHGYRRPKVSPSPCYGILLLMANRVMDRDGSASSQMPSSEITVMAKSINDGEPVQPEA